MDKPKSYKIRTLADLLEVPADRLDDCLREIGDGIKDIQTQSKLVREGWKASGGASTWVDNGIRQSSVRVQLAGIPVGQFKIKREGESDES